MLLFIKHQTKLTHAIFTVCLFEEWIFDFDDLLVCWNYEYAFFCLEKVTLMRLSTLYFVDKTPIIQLFIKQLNIIEKIVWKR